MESLKLYVWNHPYKVAYGGSIVYAIAASEDEARALAAEAPVNCYGYGAEARATGIRAIAGPPTAVHELPYAEIYEWSE